MLPVPLGNTAKITTGAESGVMLGQPLLGPGWHVWGQTLRTPAGQGCGATVARPAEDTRNASGLSYVELMKDGSG